MTPRQIEEETRALFSPRYTKERCDFDDEQFHRAERLVAEVGWHDLFPYWNNYLHSECPTAEDVVNFAHWYQFFNAEVRPVPDPIGFCGYLHFRVNVYEGDWDERITLFDGICIEILRRAGLIAGWSDPYYTPEKDPRIVAEVERLRKQVGETLGPSLE